MTKGTNRSSGKHWHVMVQRQDDPHLMVVHEWHPSLAAFQMGSVLFATRRQAEAYAATLAREWKKNGYKVLGSARTGGHVFSTDDSCYILDIVPCWEDTCWTDEDIYWGSAIKEV